MCDVAQFTVIFQYWGRPEDSSPWHTLHSEGWGKQSVKKESTDISCFPVSFPWNSGGKVEAAV